MKQYIETHFPKNPRKNCASVTIDREGSFVGWTKEAAELIGVDPAEFSKSSLPQFFSSPQPLLDAVRKCEEQDFASFQGWLYCADGSSFDVIVSLKRLFDTASSEPRFLAQIFDADAQQSEASRFLRSSKLATIGTMAGVMIHEINNPLSYVVANVDSLLEESSPVETELVLKQIKEGCQRIHRIMQDLRSFSSLQAKELKPVGVSQAIQNAVGFVGLMARHRCAIVATELGNHSVLADESRLEQVLVNLLVNAIAAFPDDECTANCIEVSVSARGPYVCLEIRDNGPGIPGDVLPRIFEPYFSTKPAGEGTGLGLYICEMIISSFKGRIEVESEQGSGTVFRIQLLPAIELRSRTDAREEVRVNHDDRRRRALIVDDDREVAQAIARMLGRRHHAEVAIGGREALSALEEAPEFDAIFCDLNMPEIDGIALYDAVRKRKPGLEKRIIFMTGGAFTDRASEFLATVRNAKLEKPFDSARALELLESR